MIININEYEKETSEFLLSIDIEHLNMFSTVEIETYNICNGICTFCPVNIRNDIRKHIQMPEELFIKIIDELGIMDYCGRLGLFSNNEPFLDFRIESFAKYAREILPKASIYIYTNGTVMTPERYLKIINYLSYLIVDNYNDKGEINEHIVPIMELCKENDYLNSKTKIVMRKQNEVLFSRGGNAPNKKNICTLKMSCVLPFKQIVIRPDGGLSLCNNDAYGQFTLGNVHKESLSEIWYSEKYNEVRKKILLGREHCELCENCDSLYRPKDY